MITDIEPLEIFQSNLGFSEHERFVNSEGNLVVVVGQRSDQSFTYAAYYWDMSEWQELAAQGWSPGAVGGLYGSFETAKAEALLFLKTRSWHNAI